MERELLTEFAPDLSQAAVIGLAEGASASVVGAPGTGKTATLIAAAAERILVRGLPPSAVLAVTTDRARATALRNRLARAVPVATDGPLARSINSLAFDVVTRAATAAGSTVPALMTGGEQDADFAALLTGHLEDGTGPDWPAWLGADVRRLRAFRTELRDLFMRATELGLAPQEIVRLGIHGGRPEWAAAGEFLDGYLEAVSASRPGRMDSTELIQFAIAAIRRGEAGALVDALQVVFVDDLQEATSSTADLLGALAARGVAVVAFGDPDVATSIFRGGRPENVGRLGAALGVDVVGFSLSTDHRQSPRQRALTRTITERIGTAGVQGQRTAGTARESDPESLPPVATLVARSSAHETAAVARHLRERHLLETTGWDELAVVVRDSGSVAGWVRSLAAAGVPTRTATGSVPLRDDPAARALLDLVDIGSGRSRATADRLSAIAIGPFGGLDAVALRRLRRALRAEELAGGGTRSADTLLLEAFAAPGRFATIDHRAARRAARLAETLAALATSAAEQASAEEMLWLAWDRSQLADAWRRRALGSGLLAAEANRALDAVTALFTSARRFAEREPDRSALAFVDSVLDADVPEDVLAPVPVGETVLVTTPTGAVGLEVSVVVVAGLQEGSWPNLRLRGSLLHAEHLVRAASGTGDDVLDDRRAVLADELRLFALATSRARDQVVVTWVDDDDHRPSPFIGLLPDDAPRLQAGGRPPLSLRGMTGALRRTVVTSGALEPESESASAIELDDDAGSALAHDAASALALAHDAASALARLAAAGVPGADPRAWHGLGAPSTTEPLYGPTEEVRVSPSKIEAIEESAVDWFVDHVAGSSPSVAMGIGTIVHWAMETAAEPTVEAVWTAIENRWGELDFEAEWLEGRQRRLVRALATGVAEYLVDFAREGKSLVGAEQRFTLRVGRATLSGSIDRVERGPDGSIVIVDLKTGTPIAPAKADAHPQLAAYQLAYADGALEDTLAALGGHRPGGAKLLYVKQGVGGKAYRDDAAQPAFDTARLAEFRQRVEQAADTMARAQFSGPLTIDERTAGDRFARILVRTAAVSHD